MINLHSPQIYVCKHYTKKPNKRNKKKFTIYSYFPCEFTDITCVYFKSRLLCSLFTTPSGSNIGRKKGGAEMHKLFSCSKNMFFRFDHIGIIFIIFCFCCCSCCYIPSLCIPSIELQICT